MSGEQVRALLPSHDVAPEGDAGAMAPPYTGAYAKHMREPAKPTWSTFYERGKEYDGTHTRFYKQRDAVMGAPVGDSVDPANFLRKGGGTRYRVPAQPCRECTHAQHNPPLVRNGGDTTGARNDNNANNGGAGGAVAGNDASTAPPPSSVDFVRDNVVAVTQMVPKRRKEQPVPATQRDDFGAVPAYLHRVKRELAREAHAVQAVQAHATQQQASAYAQYVYKLDAREHAALLADLRARLTQAMSALQRLPLHATAATASAQQRRGALERDVTRLEAAVRRLDREAVFVYRDDDGGGARAQACKSAALDEARRYAQAQR